jgi:aminomethyltransferase
MVSFAGYQMPIQYASGIVHEHLHCRSHAGLFDVSHMGQVSVVGRDAARQLETLMPVDLEVMAVGQQCYSVLTNEQGGVIDDLIIARHAREHFALVVNAGCKDEDVEYLRQRLPNLQVHRHDDLALLALQGPQAADVLRDTFQSIDQLAFMHGVSAVICGVDCYISRCGYTGEDGFEISLPMVHAKEVAEHLLQHDSVAWIGLGARDSLRLEAGLCLYGQDLTAQVTPIEAHIGWCISRSRRTGGVKEGGFVGAETILRQQRDGPSRRRVGLIIEGRAPVRQGAVVVNQQGSMVGEVTSGGFGPTLNAPVAMASVDVMWSVSGTQLSAIVRGQGRAVTVVDMPWVAHNYYRLRA